MLTNDADRRWEIVHHDGGDPVVRRYPVPGGWLYQVSGYTPNETRSGSGYVQWWHPPTFVLALSRSEPKDHS